jgi:carboxyl-terminal processing protease
MLLALCGCMPPPVSLRPLAPAAPSKATGAAQQNDDPTALAAPPSPQAVQALAARQLYLEVWGLIYEEYVDGTFNGQRWGTWRDFMKNRLRDKEDAKVAIDTMLASLNDDYTRYLPPREMSEQRMNIDAKLYGVGIQITGRNNKIVVVSPIEGTPADKAGLQPNDLIMQINGHTTSGLSVDQVADRIRGPKGSVVRLTLQRTVKNQATKRIFSVNLVRDEIKIHNVKAKMLPTAAKGQRLPIGYLQISSFIGENLMEEITNALGNIRPAKALVLDLRGNYGGLLSNAVEVAELFLSHGGIVAVVDRAGDTRRIVSKLNRTDLLLPLVVLIDGGSASASEIVAGALQDNRRARLVGHRSFGKGLVQKIHPLSDGSGLNVTISRYLTPNGHDIHLKGIAPDVEVKNDVSVHSQRISIEDKQLAKAVALLQAAPAAPAPLAKR